MIGGNQQIVSCERYAKRYISWLNYTKIITILRQKIIPIFYIYTEGYSESTEPIDAVNILPLARFEPTTSTTPPSTTPDIDATNCATETSPIKDVQEALILTTPDAVHVVNWFLFNAWHLFRSQVKARCRFRQ